MVDGAKSVLVIVERGNALTTTKFVALQRNAQTGIATRGGYDQASLVDASIVLEIAGT